jgi:hypothetical protein
MTETPDRPVEPVIPEREAEPGEPLPEIPPDASPPDAEPLDEPDAPRRDPLGNPPVETDDDDEVF